MPLLLVSSMAVTLGATHSAAAADGNPVKRTPKAKSSAAPVKSAAIQSGSITAARASVPTITSVSISKTKISAAPATYRVSEGDTVSSIAGRFGLSTASVLALNGLGWKSTIFPGQQLRLGGAGGSTAPSSSSGDVTRYTIVSGDTISAVAKKFGVSTAAVLSANGLSATSLIYPGQRVTVPSSHGATISVAAASSVSPIVSTSKSPKSYVIATGDTVSSIAARFGVPATAILEANGLGATSMIYAGRTISIPRASEITTLTSEMRSNARVIIRVGRDLGVSDYGIVVALAAGMQESGLRNLDYGHLDSVGLFQQRPSSGWGTPAQLQDPVYASRLFYGGANNPNAGITPGLLDIPGWKAMSVTRAAQAVQVSAHPVAYAKWEKSARSWLKDLG